jgi:hypothetical protein
MFWGDSEIEIGDVFELCMWCNRKPDFGAIVKSFINPPAISTVNRTFRIHMHYKIDRSWRYSRPILMPSESKSRYWTTVLDLARNLEAKDPRDYIYAFLGCPLAVGENGRPLVQADYTCTVEEAYTRVTHALIHHSREGPRVFSAVRPIDREIAVNSQTPSWMPRWKSDPHTKASSTSSSEFWYKAGGPEPWFSVRQQKENWLEVGGFVFDKIVWMSDLLKANNMRLHPRLWAPEIMGVDGEPLIDSLWSKVQKEALELGVEVQEDEFLLTLAKSYPGQRTSYDPKLYAHRHRDLIAAYRKAVRDNLSNASKSDHTSNDAAFFEKQLVENQNLRFAVTLNGRIGMVPGLSTQVGDLCGIFFGVSVPLILTPSRDGRHRLIGDTYIQGVMNGELITRFRNIDISAEKIVLE